MGWVSGNALSNSKLPGSVGFFLSRSLVTVPLGLKLLKVTSKALDLMLYQLAEALLRELTGQTHYRSCGIL